MEYYNILAILFTPLICITSTEISADSSPALSFLVKSKESGENQKEIVDGGIESIRIWIGDTITFTCTTKSVHMWDGKIDHGKFTVAMKAVERNSSGYFTSSISLQLGESPTQDFSFGIFGFTQNYVKCFELDSEKGFSQDDIPMGKDIPEWLWRAENNSVECHVDNPSRMKLKSIYCENPSLCNIRRSCTPKTCPSFMVAANPCEKLCSRQAMESDYTSGQLECDANGFSTHLNFFKGFNFEMCYFKPHRGVSFCQVLDIEIPDVDIFHGLPFQLHGRASKFVIIQKPEVDIILSNGQVLITPDVHIISEPKHDKKQPYFMFMVNGTANSNTKHIKVIGHRYDSNEPVVIRKQLKIKVGMPPEITGLPNELKLLKSDASTVLPFKIIGLPDPTFALSFNGMVLNKTDRRFSFFVDKKGYKYLKIHTINGNFYGTLKISARNIFGNHEFTIDIKETLRMTKTEAYRGAALLVVLIVFIHYLAFTCLCKLCRRFYPRPTAV